MTKNEIKEVMEEMECWSCDNHLNICDKHTPSPKKCASCKSVVCITCSGEGECTHWPNHLRPNPPSKECSCNIRKGSRGWTDYEIHERGCELDTPTPPSKECEQKRLANNCECKTCLSL